MLPGFRKKNPIFLEKSDFSQQRFLYIFFAQRDAHRLLAWGERRTQTTYVERETHTDRFRGREIHTQTTYARYYRDDDYWATTTTRRLLRRGYYDEATKTTRLLLLLGHDYY